MNIIIVAHYHKEGKIRTDTLRFLENISERVEKIYFISTNLRNIENYIIPSNVEIIERKNEGYDFFSYREGILRAYSFRKDKISSITLMNTSFIISEPSELYESYFYGIFSNIDENTIQGLTKSYEYEQHIQSYLMSFSGRLLDEEKFMHWWKTMEPLNERFKVIQNYELGFSRHLLNLGYSLNASIIGHAQDPISNPSHFYYMRLLIVFGVIKIEIIKTNPFDLNLILLNDRLKNDSYLLDFYNEALAN